MALTTVAMYLQEEMVSNFVRKKSCNRPQHLAHAELAYHWLEMLLTNIGVQRRDQLRSMTKISHKTLNTLKSKTRDSFEIAGFT